VKNLFNENIYPNKDEFYDATIDYMVKNHGEFFENLSEIRWRVFYNKNIDRQVILEQFALLI